MQGGGGDGGHSEEVKTRQQIEFNQELKIFYQTYREDSDGLESQREQ